MKSPNYMYNNGVIRMTKIYRISFSNFVVQNPDVTLNKLTSAFNKAWIQMPDLKFEVLPQSRSKES